jgi:hypothetical protein
LAFYFPFTSAEPPGCPWKLLKLAFFHSDDKLDSAPYYTFRIHDVNMLQVPQHGARHPAQFSLCLCLSGLGVKESYR